MSISKIYTLEVETTEQVSILAENLKEARMKLKERMSDLSLTKDYKRVIRTIAMQRSAQQNKSIHKYFSMVADELNEKGITFDKIIEEGFELIFSPEIIKNQIWKPLQKELLDKDSTTKLDRSREIDLIYDSINKRLGSFGIYVPFPNNEEKND